MVKKMVDPLSATFDTIMPSNNAPIDVRTEILALLPTGEVLTQLSYPSLYAASPSMAMQFVSDTLATAAHSLWELWETESLSLSFADQPRILTCSWRVSLKITNDERYKAIREELQALGNPANFQ
jgi:hypothetical protein